MHNAGSSQHLERSVMSEQDQEERVRGVRTKFKHEGFVLDIDGDDEAGYTAAYRPASQDIGSAPHASGETRADAAEAAWLKHQVTKAGGTT
jgi:hypothetical protein